MTMSVFAAHPQAAFVKGYIVTLKGDTVRGEAKVNPKKEHDNYYKIMFRDTNGQQKTYKPEKLRAYGFNDQRYISITEDDESLFYKELSRGYITLYKFVYEGLKMNKPIWVPEYYLRVPDEKKLVPVKENKFKKQVSEWMDDNMSLLNEFEDSKEFDPEKAADLISRYNTWKASQNNQ